MKRLKGILAGVLSLGLGVVSIWLAVGFYMTGRDLVPFTGGLRGQDYALFLTLGASGWRSWQSRMCSSYAHPVLS